MLIYFWWSTSVQDLFRVYCYYLNEVNNWVFLVCKSNGLSKPDKWPNSDTFQNKMLKHEVYLVLFNTLFAYEKIWDFQLFILIDKLLESICASFSSLNTGLRLTHFRILTHQINLLLLGATLDQWECLLEVPQL